MGKNGQDLFKIPLFNSLCHLILWRCFHSHFERVLRPETYRHTHQGECIQLGIESYVKQLTYSQILMRMAFHFFKVILFIPFYFFFIPNQCSIQFSSSCLFSSNIFCHLMDLVLMHNENNPLLEKKHLLELMQCSFYWFWANLPELVGGELLQSISKVLPGKWPVLASLSSILLQVVSGLLRYNYKNSSHQTFVCNKALLCCFDTTGLSYYSYNCNLHLLYMFLCCWCSEKPWYEYGSLSIRFHFWNYFFSA